MKKEKDAASCAIEGFGIVVSQGYTCPLQYTYTADLNIIIIIATIIIFIKNISEYHDIN